MTKKYLFLSLVSTLLFIISSCNIDNKRALPNVKGKAYELTIVIEKSQWKDIPGKLLRSVFNKEIDYLPQPEPQFSITHIPHEAFTSVFIHHRNILNINFGDFNEPTIIYKKDMWAYPQYYVEIRAKNYEDFKEVFNKNKTILLNFFIDAEKKRMTEHYIKFVDKDLTKKINSLYNISLTIPKGYSLDVDSVDFAWLSHEAREIQQGIFIYTYPYTDTNTFTADYLVKKRNEFLKKYVPGPSDGSYMTTEMQIPVSFSEFSIDGKYYSKISGLWKVENDFMGGPFYSISTVDEKINRVVCVEGFVYYPKKEKRNLMKQLEVICESLRVD